MFFRVYIFLSALFFSIATLADINWVSVYDIYKSLENEGPINVGFDIDQTMLFTSPGVFYYISTHCPEDYKKCHDSLEYWKFRNTVADKYNLPKLSAKALIRMHQDRGDNIFFITGRPSTPKENVTEILQKEFGIEKMNPVIFVAVMGAEDFGQHKSEHITKHNIRIYYGDSDGDMLQARKAGIRGIRVLRALNARDPAQGKVCAGCFGEEVMMGSDL